jgi:hypothetical protein
MRFARENEYNAWYDGGDDDEIYNKIVGFMDQWSVSYEMAECLIAHNHLTNKAIIADIIYHWDDYETGDVKEFIEDTKQLKK